MVVPNDTPSIDAAGASTNAVITTIANQGYTLSNTLSVGSFSLTSVAAGTFASDAKVRIRCSAYPFLFADARLTDGGPYTGVFQAPSVVETLSGTLTGWFIPAGSELSFEFFELFQDAPDGQIEQTISGLILSTNVAAAPPAQIQNYTFGVPVPFTGTFGQSANFITSFANTASEIILGNVIVVNGGTWEQLVPGERAREARGLITHFFNQAVTTSFSIFPGVDVEPGVGNTIPVAPGGPRVLDLSGPLTGSIIPAMGRWVFRFWTDDLDAAGSPESQITGLQVGIVGQPAPVSRVTFTVPGTINSADDARQPTNTFLNLTETTPTTFNLGSTVLVRSGVLTMVGVPSDADDFIIRLQNSAYPFAFAEFRPSNEFFYTSPNTLVPFARTLTGSLVGRSIPAGSTWTIAAYHDGGGDDQDRIDGQVEQTLANFSFSLTGGPSIGNTAPPGSVDLGRIRSDNSPFVFQTGAFSPGQIKWYRFTIPELSNNSAFLDIFTSALQSGLADTEIALYDNWGRLIMDDDDDAELLFSALSFGRITPPRTFLDDGMPRNGREGFLAAGQYYLAVAPFNATFGDRFAVSTTSGSVPIGTEVTIDTTLPPPTLTGTVWLEDFVGSRADEILAVTLTDGVVSYQGTASMNASGQYFLSLPLLIDPGVYSVLIKGDTFLRERVDNVTISLSGGVAGATLENGDVTNDNEVGPADFAILAAAFGSFTGDPTYVEAADLNVDGEVGPTDFAILAGNFGQFGD